MRQNKEIIQPIKKTKQKLADLDIDSHLDSFYYLKQFS